MAEASGDAGSEPPEPTHRTAVLELACLPVGRSSSWCRRTEGSSPLLAHELDDDLPFAAAVQLHQEQPLPLAQH